MDLTCSVQMFVQFSVHITQHCVCTLSTCVLCLIWNDCISTHFNVCRVNITRPHVLCQCVHELFAQECATLKLLQRLLRYSGNLLKCSEKFQGELGSLALSFACVSACGQANIFQFLHAIFELCKYIVSRHEYQTQVGQSGLEMGGWGGTPPPPPKIRPWKLTVLPVSNTDKSFTICTNLEAQCFICVCFTGVDKGQVLALSW